MSDRANDRRRSQEPYRGRSRSRDRPYHSERRYLSRDRNHDRSRSRERGGRARESEKKEREDRRYRSPRSPSPHPSSNRAHVRSRSRRRSRSRSPRRRRSRSRSRLREAKDDGREHRRGRSTSRSSLSDSERNGRGERSRQKRRHSRSRSMSSSVSDTSDRRKRPKEKLRKRRSKSRDREKKERKKEKKEKKKKKSAAVSHQWGKYGIINETDLYNKEQEFRAWLVEERKINPETISKDQTKKEFARFVEDYNTATLPHEKFYHMEAYERRMTALRAGEFVPPPDDSYDPDADLRALQSTHKRRAVERETYMSKEQLQELRRVQNERIEVRRALFCISCSRSHMCVLTVVILSQSAGGEDEVVRDGD
ncbi:hypothetical protein AcV5_002124 [Taiwanofungus camphoratus]|nr:hypothetical protein AcV5_002124 [Antrodia cinnamomea]KAI0943954.1 hypothetical protein AcV7_001898 [Antrodia cinnamomea]